MSKKHLTNAKQAIDACQREEVETYSRAMSICSALLSPETTNPSNVPNALSQGPMNSLVPKVVTTLSLPQDQTNVEFAIVAFPTLYNSLYMTNYAATAPMAFHGVRNFQVGGYPSNSTTPPGRLDLGSLFSFPNDGQVQAQLLWSNADGSVRAFSYWDPDIESWIVPWGVTYANNTTDTVYVTTSQLINDTTVASSGYNTGASVDGAQLASIGDSGIPIPPGVHTLDWFTMSIPNPSGGFVVNSVTQTVAVPNTLVQVKGTTKLLYAVQTDLFSTIESIAESITVLGMTLLGTYQGSSLNDGGNIAATELCARADYDPPPGSYYTTLAQIPGAYNGPIKTGAWGYWMPEKLSDHELRPVHTRALGHPCLVFAGHIADPTQEFRITFSQLVRFTTLSRIYSPIHYAVDPVAWSLAITVLSRMQYCCCNPDHESRVKKVLRILQDHAPQIKSGAHAAFKVARQVAPILAAAFM